MKYKAYKKDLDYSYVKGIFPSLELVEKRPDLVREILISPDYDKKDQLIEKLEEEKIPYKIDQKSINRISRKNNNYLVGVFNKEYNKIREGNHILLDRPANMGNLGTIIRTMLGMGYRDLAITSESCDYFDPRVLRASMGAFFDVNIQSFPSIKAYKEAFPDNQLYLFMLGEDSLLDVKKPGRHTLCFGNEGSGLREGEKKYGRALMIPQEEGIDSFNLPISAAMAMFYFKEIIS